MISTRDTSLSACPRDEVLPGQVAKCRNDVTAETVPIKIIKNKVSDEQIQQELPVLEVLTVLDPENNNMEVEDMEISMTDTSLSTRPRDEVLPGQSLCSHSSSYTVLDLVGEGSYGKVAKCRNDVTAEAVAVKIMKHRVSDELIQQELSMFEVLSVLDPERSNMVKLLETFQDLDHTCMVFEMLDMNLDQLFQHLDTPVPLKGIQTIAQQLFEALDALQGLGVVHGDIKPNNVMLVNHQQQPYKVKLIDFGLAFCSAKPSRVLPVCGFRAPECFFGLPVSGAVDVWGVGCILSFLYLREYMFDILCEYKCMRNMVKVLGFPKVNLLQRGRTSRSFFTVDESFEIPKWRLLTPVEFFSQSGHSISQENCHYPLNSIKDLIKLNPQEAATQKIVFVDLLRNILNWDFNVRITPRKALSHPFLTVIPRAERTCSLATPVSTPAVQPQTAGINAPSPGPAESSPASTPVVQPQTAGINAPSPGPAESSPASNPVDQPQTAGIDTPSPGPAESSPASNPVDQPQTAGINTPSPGPAESSPASNPVDQPQTAGINAPSPGPAESSPASTPIDQPQTAGINTPSPGPAESSPASNPVDQPQTAGIDAASPGPAESSPASYPVDQPQTAGIDAASPRSAESSPASTPVDQPQTAGINTPSPGSAESSPASNPIDQPQTAGIDAASPRSAESSPASTPVDQPQTAGINTPSPGSAESSPASNPIDQPQTAGIDAASPGPAESSPASNPVDQPQTAGIDAPSPGLAESSPASNPVDQPQTAGINTPSPGLAKSSPASTPIDQPQTAGINTPSPGPAESSPASYPVDQPQTAGIDAASPGLAESSPASTPIDQPQTAGINAPSPGSAESSPASTPVDQPQTAGIDAASPGSAESSPASTPVDQPQTAGINSPPYSGLAETRLTSTPDDQRQITVPNRPPSSGSAHSIPVPKPAETPQTTGNGGWRNFWLRAGGAAIGGAVGAFSGFSLRDTAPHKGAILGAAAGSLLGGLLIEGLVVRRSKQESSV